MEESNSTTDSIILEYLRKNCRYAVVKAFAKTKNIDLNKDNDDSTTLKDVLSAYKTSLSSTKDKSQFITSTPKPTIPSKPTDTSSSSDDSDDEADSDDQDKGVEKAEKKKLLTKSRKKSPGMKDLIVQLMFQLFQY